jgi:hypothetical protein
LLVLTAALVGWRRLAGALGSPLDPAVLMGLGVVLALVAAGLRTFGHRFAPATDGRRGGWLVRALLSAAVLVLAVSLSVAGTAPVALIAFWALVGAEELWAWRPTVWRGRSAVAQREAASLVSADPSVDSDLIQSTATAELDDTPSSVAPPAIDEPADPNAPMVLDDAVPSSEVMQQLTRSRAADGSEELSGWLRDRFEAGQRTSNVHVAFCPPFGCTPKVSVEHVGGPTTRIKTARVLPFGVRLDLKLAVKTDESADVLLKFSARGQAPG